MCICADAVRRLYPGATDSEVRKVVSTWLTGSRDRDNGKMEREEAKKTRQAAAGTGTTGRGRERKQKGRDRQKIGSKSLFSPEIPDRRETSDIPSLPLGGAGGGGGGREQAPPVCNLRAVIWFPFPVSSLVCFCLVLLLFLSCHFSANELSPDFFPENSNIFCFWLIDWWSLI